MFDSKTKMKLLTTRNGFKVHELGDLFYFFEPSIATDRVIISAHGGHKVVGGTNRFEVPEDVVLRFYSDDTFSVLDPGFNDFYTKEAAPKEIITEGDFCFDYILSKYQGSHGNESETYDSIGKIISSVTNTRSGMSAKAATASGKQKDQMLNIANRAKVAAVLTVRNRWFKGDATLSKVVKAVKQHAPTIVIFDCLFCRSTMFGGSQGVTLVDRR